MTSIQLRKKITELLGCRRRALHVTENLTRTATPKLSPYDVRSYMKKM